MENNHCQIKNHRSLEQTKNLIKRLNRIEGQIRGISKMVEEDRCCDEILIQISAVNKSLTSLGQKLLANHFKTCLVNSVKNDKLEVIDEFLDLTWRLM